MNKAVNNKSKILYQLQKLRKLSQPFFLPIDQCNGFQFIWLLISLLFFSCFLRAKKLPEPTKNKPEKNNPHQLDQIPLIVFSTPPKYFTNYKN